MLIQGVNVTKTTWLAALCLAAGCAYVSAAETIRVAIGHQSMCTDTYTGGIIVKELKLLEKYLPKTGKYQGAKYEIEWKDYDRAKWTATLIRDDRLVGHQNALVRTRARHHVPAKQGPVGERSGALEKLDDRRSRVVRCGKVNLEVENE